MVASHSRKKQLLETQEINQQHETNSGTLKTDDDPLNILKIRLAKGEITKAEYEETRKIIEPQWY